MEEDKPFCLEDYPQDAVLQDYTEALKGNKRLAGNVHMFFSPNRIPVGLTDTELRFCALYLYPLKRDLLTQQRKQIENAFGDRYLDPFEQAHKLVHIYQTEVRLPSEFRPNVLMTRERFNEGVRKFYELTFKLLPN